MRSPTGCFVAWEKDGGKELKRLKRLRFLHRKQNISVHMYIKKQTSMDLAADCILQKGT